MTDEKRLFKALHSGKKEEPEVTFQFIYNKYKPLVTFVVAQYIKNESDIDDIVQETFINFFNNIEKVQSSIKTYLTVSCKNIAFNFLKRNKNINYINFDDITYLDVEHEHLANDRLINLLSDMKRVISEEDIKIILLHLANDLKFDEIALKLNQNVKTIKTKYYRALKKYKKIKGVLWYEKNWKRFFKWF